MQVRPDLIVCEECDAVYRRSVLARGEAASCLRCEAELECDVERQLLYLLPLTLASLIMFLIANCFPIVAIELQGLSSRTTLIGVVLMLNSEGMLLVALLVLVTTILFPLVQLLILLYLLLSIAKRLRPPGMTFLLKLMQLVRPWGMVEVFLLGGLVALVKLTNMATVLPGVALWAFAVLTILLTVVVSFNPHYLWRALMDTQESNKHDDNG